MPDNRSVCQECGDIYDEDWSPECSCYQIEIICENNQYIWKGI